MKESVCFHLVINVDYNSHTEYFHASSVDVSPTHQRRVVTKLTLEYSKQIFTVKQKGERKKVTTNLERMDQETSTDSQ